VEYTNSGPPEWRLRLRLRTGGNFNEGITFIITDSLGAVNGGSADSARPLVTSIENKGFTEALMGFAVSF
jgi:hypothetical protein